MQTTTSPVQIAAQIGRTDRPAVTPLTQLVAKMLNQPTAVATAPEPQSAAAKAQPAPRPDGRDIRLGSLIDIRV